MTKLIRREGASLLLENDCFRMVFDVSGLNPRVSSLVLKSSGREYAEGPGREFCFTVAGEVFAAGKSRVRETLLRELPDGGECADIVCATHDDKFEVVIHLTVYPGIPGYRKSLSIARRGTEAVLERIMIHETGAAPAKWCDCDFYSGHEFRPEPVNFILEGDGELLTCHDPVSRHGWLFASGVPGVLRFMMAYPHWNNVSAGYSQSAAACAKILEPGETFDTAPIFFTLFEGAVGNAGACAAMASLIRHSLPAEQFGDAVMYCTWIPFLTDISEAIVMRQIDAAKALGFTCFVLDDGWFKPRSDWEVDRVKFPGGLEKVERAVHAAGMKFGLWFNIGTDYGMKDANERDCVRDALGRIKPLGPNLTRCPASAHRDIVLGELSSLAEKYRIDYFKLDFSTISSPYGVVEYGCHAHDHHYHRGWNDSFPAMFDGLRAIRDGLKAKYPELIVDFSFESFGTERPNVAGLMYSDVQHVSNLNAAETRFQSIERLRRNIYSWIGVLPPERILHALLALGNARAPEYVLTGFCGAPLYAGDFALMDSQVKSRIAGFIARYHAIAGSEVLTGFEVLANETDFDGFRRFGKSGHGFACFFNRSDAARETPYGRVEAHDCAMLPF